MPSMKEIYPVCEVSQSSTEEVTISNIFEVRSLIDTCMLLLTLVHSDRPKLYTILACLSAKGLKTFCGIKIWGYENGS